MARLAVVSGGGTGIGRSIAGALAGEGYDVLIVGRRAEVLTDAVKWIGPQASAVTADLSDPAQIAAVVEAVGVPVNVLGLPTGPTMAELASVGVRRVSVGSLLASAAYAALVAGGRELLDEGTSTYARSRVAEDLRGQAFG